MASEKKSKFVLIELAEPSVVDVLTRLRGFLGKKPRKTAIHITIRGPYGRDPRKALLERMEKRIRGEPLLIAGAGRFQNGSTHIVYLRVSAKFLKELWWKPDYPLEKYGFHPHITIYEGEDEETADLVFQFLRKEKIELLCFKYSVRLHDKHRRPVVVAIDGAESASGATVKWGKVSPGLLERAARIGRSVNLTRRQGSLF